VVSKAYKEFVDATCARSPRNMVVTLPGCARVTRGLRGDARVETSCAGGGVTHYGRMEIPRVPNIGHSGKKLFPECYTRGRNALGEEGLPRVLDSPWHSGK
jgi:hypothetical protein